MSTTLNTSLIKSLPNLLNQAALTDKGITFIRKTGIEDEFVSYSELQDLALILLGSLQSQDIKSDDVVVLQLRDEKHFLISFWACILGKFIPVPLSLAENESSVDKLVKILSTLKGATVLIDDEEGRSKIIRISESLSGIPKPKIIYNVAESSVRYLDLIIPTIEPQDIAFIQFSSGSTSNPKGVCLTHQNLIININDIVTRYQLNGNDSSLSWMPLTHDMGLICFHLTSLAAAIDQYVMPTSIFIKRPLLWMEKASLYSITQIYSPNFGYHYLLSALKANKNQRWDLSNIRLIYNGAELISWKLCTTFMQALMEYGLRQNVMYPGYGLAEASVAVSLPYLNDPPKVYHLDRSRLRMGNTIVESEDGLEFVSVGSPIDHCKIRMCSDGGKELSDRTIGNIEISGGNVTSSYYNNEIANGEVFTRDGWLKTGDVGFIDNGKLIVTGRKKNIIIVNGQNYYPHDVERCICNRITDFQLGKVVVCASRNSNHHDDIIVFLLYRGSLEHFLPYIIKVKSIVYNEFGLVVKEVLPVKNIPKTTSGKIQNFLLIEKLNLGEFAKVTTDINLLLKKIRHGTPQSKEQICDQLNQIWHGNLGNAPISVDQNFVEVGTNSLSLIRFAGTIQEITQYKITLEDIFQNPSLERLSQFLSYTFPLPQKARIPLAPFDEYYSLTSTQMHFWLMSKLPEIGATLHLRFAFKVTTEVNNIDLEQAVNLMVQKIESLRTVFVEFNGLPKQKILNGDELKFALDCVDHSNSSYSETESLNLVIQNDNKAFDLATWPLMRMTLINGGSKDPLLFISIHHIICDGWSLNILAKELISEFLKSTPTQHVVERNVQMKDIAVWEELEYDNEITENRKYWLSELSQLQPSNGLKFRNSREEILSFKGHCIETVISDELSSKITFFAQQQKSTTFVVLCAVLKVLIFKYTGENDVVIGTDSAGRGDSEVQFLVGNLLRTLPIRSTIQDDHTFESVIKRVQTKVNAAIDHQNYSFNSVVSELGLVKDFSRNPVFDVLLLFQNFTFDYSNDLNKIEGIHEIKLKPEWVLADLEFEFFFQEKKLMCHTKFNAQLFERKEISLLVQRYFHLIRVLINNSVEPLGKIDFLLQDEANLILNFNKLPQDDKQIEQDVIVAFQRQVEFSPTATAISSSGSNLTYYELNQRANRIAHVLIDDFGVLPGSNVGLCVERNEMTIVSILAILKCAATYVPIDLHLPKQRKQYIVEDCKLKLTIVDDSVDFTFNQVLSLKELSNRSLYFRHSNPDICCTERPAYIMYTSGSGGNPKGVQISHTSLFDYVVTFNSFFNIDSRDTIIQQSSLGFDVSIEEIFPVLCAGGKLLIAKNGGADIDGLLDLIEENENCTLSTTPLVVNELNKYSERLYNLKLLICGGDTIKQSYIDNLISKVPVYNTYGPTEATVCVTYNRINNLNERDVIGHVLPNHRIFILDEFLNICPIGVAGEIFISGTGLSNGYINNEAETSRQFLRLPEICKQDVYRTGDWGIWLETGKIKFLGRKDSQIKWRGYRIEVTEIEHRITSYPGIDNAIVLIHGEDRAVSDLIAFIVSGTKVDLIDLRSFIAECLPVYMVPTRIISVDKIPWTLNGKVDKKALINSVAIQDWQTDNGSQEITEMEAIVLQIWREVLGKSDITVSNGFFDLGGDSIKAAKISALLFTRYKINSLITDVLRNPSIKRFTQCISNGPEFSMEKLNQIEEQEYYSLSNPQQRIFILENTSDQSSMYCLSGSFELLGELNEQRIEHAFSSMLRKYELLRTTIILVNGLPKQRINELKETGFKLQVVDATREDHSFVNDLILNASNSVMPFNAPVLLQATLIKTDKDKYILTLKVHHIIMDGQSVSFFLKQLFRFYNRTEDNEEMPERSSYEIQYKDYSAWHNKKIISNEIKKTDAFWLAYLAGDLQTLKLNTDFPRPVRKTYVGAVHHFRLDEQLWLELRRIARLFNSSVFVVVTAIYQVCLYRITHKKQILIGLPVSGRTHPMLVDMLGVFINTLPLRSIINDALSFGLFLRQVDMSVVNMIENQLSPLDLIVSKLAKRSSERDLFEVGITWLSADERAFHGRKMINDNLSITAIDEDTRATTEKASKHDLWIHCYEDRTGVNISVEYNSGLFTRNRISAFSDVFLSITKQIIDNPEIGILTLKYEAEIGQTEDQSYNSFKY